ncbi:hypothetical protein IscW_ISCW022673 [Ixodes scapularis]|uniref:Ig-like domain-containing protein n=1 Tax=Ixodes scapularis TaxID=6945 RepID=B7QC91_IXOSC|nr:hypothetical protein IscW_ISCW022673 [Ixodes scapularis]|eukprot:XP_002413155.1 hypothetical protein IscW_ISCW022673 [Ixodes scapularis]
MPTVNKSFFEPLHPEEEADEQEATELPPSVDFKRTERSGTSITLVCPGATEKSPVAWFFNGSKFRAPWRRVLLDDRKQIVFKQLRQRDSGVYECTLLGVKVGHLELHGKNTMAF